MDNWLVATKFIILFYCIIRFVMGDMADITFLLLSILIYISLSMLSYVLKDMGHKRSMLILACIVVFVSAYAINAVFFLLLPVNMAEITISFTKSLKICAFSSLAPVFICEDGYKPEYILISLISFCIFTLCYKVYSSIKVLKKENEFLRERNDLLDSRLDMGEEYENQLKYFSQLEERNNLAQKIHDKVGHTIAGSLIQLEAASVIIDRDRKKTGEILNNVVFHLKEGMEDIRSTLRSIKPTSEQLGINSLKMMLDEFSLNNPINTSFTFKGRMDIISHGQWKIIKDNISEALTNTLKYSSASTVKVDIEVMNKLIRAEVRDNGTGTLSLKKGLGITGMDERTENAGGKLIIDGSKGFSIITLLPVNEVAHGDKNINSR